MTYLIDAAQSQPEFTRHEVMRELDERRPHAGRAALICCDGVCCHEWVSDGEWWYAWSVEHPTGEQGWRFDAEERACPSCGSFDNYGWTDGA